MQGTSEAIEKLINPAVESHDLESDLPAVWRALKTDPQAAADIASLLRIAPAQLQQMEEAPVRLEQSEAGLAGSDIVVLVATWVGSEVLLGALADLGKEAVKDALRALWTRHLKPGLQKLQRKPGALGD